MKKLTAHQFIERAKSIHGEKYDYSNIIYTKLSSKIDIECTICGTTFNQTGANHLQGQGCPTCGANKAAKNRILTNEEYISRAQKVHGQKYGYGEVDYTGARHKIKIFCKRCGEFFYQTPCSHLTGRGCPICGHRKDITNKEVL